MASSREVKSQKKCHRDLEECVQDRSAAESSKQMESPRWKLKGRRVLGRWKEGWHSRGNEDRQQRAVDPALVII